MSETKILFVGAGAVGASVAAWTAAAGADVAIVDVGDVQAALRACGITTYQVDRPDSTRRSVAVRAVDRLADFGDAEIVVLAVKNYNLVDAAKRVREAFGDRPIIVSMANGVENQQVLPKLFSRVIYCVVGYNARRDPPMMIGYQKKGPLLIGTPDNSLSSEMRLVQTVLARGCPTDIVDRLQDAVHTKIVMNLTNALDALVGRGYHTLSSFPVYQHVLLQTLWEGVEVIRAAGYREFAIAGMPSFTLLTLARLLPGWMIRPIFRQKLRLMVMASMTQDVVLRGGVNTELDSITGYLVRLATKVGVAAPYNQAIYRLGKEKFHPGFRPLRCEDVFAAVQQPAGACPDGST